MCREKRQVVRSALQEPRFRRYYPASWFSGLGSWMLRFILGWSAWELTMSPLWVGIVGALMLAPALVLSPYFGVQSDRINPRHGLMASMLIHSLIGLVGATMTLLGLFDRFTLLLLATALGSASAIHSPMRLALVPLLVPRAALPSAIGLTAMSFNIARILGPALSAALIARWGVSWAWIAAVGFFVLSGVILASLQGVGSRPPRLNKSVNREFIDGLNYVRGSPAVTLILISTIVNGLLGRSFIELLPAVSGRLLLGGAGELAWLTAAAGVGAVLGGLVMSRQSAHISSLYRLIVTALFVAALLLATLTWIRELATLALMVGLLSFTTTIAGTGCQALMQLVIDAQYHGRVMSLWSMTMMASPAMGAATNGAVAEWAGFVTTFAVVSIAGVLAAVALYPRRRVLVAFVPAASATTSDSR
ncbi:MAG: MFS transporter [Pseudomonadales bacterium]|nr:MFS transporter [Pseudomonadales bacterium]